MIALNTIRPNIKTLHLNLLSVPNDEFPLKVLNLIESLESLFWIVYIIFISCCFAVSFIWLINPGFQWDDCINVEQLSNLGDRTLEITHHPRSILHNDWQHTCKQSCKKSFLSFLRATKQGSIEFLNQSQVWFYIASKNVLSIFLFIALVSWTLLSVFSRFSTV